MQNEFDLIKKQTRLALPTDNGYIFRLGTALYGFASISSFMTEITNHIDPTADRTALQSKTGGEILSAFRNRVRLFKEHYPELERLGRSAAELFETLNTERSDIVHSYPITGTNNNQILHRRVDSKGKYFEVTNEFLDSFISRLHDVSSLLYQIRKLVRPEIGD